MENYFDSSKPGLKKSIVSFIDILGFSSLVMENQSCGNKLLKDIHEKLNNQYRFLEEMNIHSQIKYFTDNIILAYPLWEDGEAQLGTLLTTLLNTQLEMMFSNYFIRGGVSLGDYYGDDKFAFGPALIEANKLEGEEACFPRIILSDDIKELVTQYLEDYSSREKTPYYEYLLKDQDEYYFINYLNILKENNEEYLFKNGEGGTTNKVYIDSLEKHKNIIVNNLDKYKEHDSKIYEKYNWSAQYHNYYCAEDEYLDSQSKCNLCIEDIEDRYFSKIDEI